MARGDRGKESGRRATSTSLMVRLDEQSKSFVAQAAELRQISVSDYVRVVTVAQARREVESARNQTICLTSEEQIAFWNALNQPPTLSGSQRQLGAIMRGEA